MSIFEDLREFKVKKEMRCRNCLHGKVCSMFYESFCLNYISGAAASSCNGCLNRFTRYDKDKLPCFICKYFVRL